MPTKRPVSKRTLVRRYAKAARVAGSMGEQVVFDLYGLRESDNIEIKAAAAHEYRVVVGLQQILNNQSKTYVIVVYDRQVTRVGASPRLYARTPEDAFKQPLKIILTDAQTILKVILSEQLRLRGVYNEYGWANVKVWVPLSLLMTSTPTEREGHLVYGSESLLPKQGGNLALQPSYENVPWGIVTEDPVNPEEYHHAE